MAQNEEQSTGAAVIKLLTLYSETRVHPGTGQTTGAIDLPVQRERHTQMPIIPASSLKGSLREAAESEWGRGDASVSVLFGPPTSQQLHGGAIAFGEARLLAFPVRSLQQLFLWVTCPFIISRLVREITLMGGTISLAAPPVAEGCAVVADQSLSDDIVLEDLSFKATCDGDWGRTATELAKRLLPEGAAYDWVREKFKKHLVLISDDDFSYLVRYATEVTARIVLDDEKKTSENLWYEESLPRDCLFYAWLRCERPRDPKKNSGIGSPADVAQKLEELVRARSFIQIGGNETVGQGWCKLRLVDLPSLS